jgi:ABC-2 type transport system ATP-binding protein
MGLGLLPLLVLAGIIYGVYRFVTQRAENKRSRSQPSEPEWGAKPKDADPNLLRGSSTVPSIVRHGNSSDGWAVETHGLTKRFGDNVAVNGVELLVPRGCAFGYLGPNGAGKTTLIRVLLGLTHADGGTMSLLGYAVPRHRDKALARVGAIVDEPRFNGHLSGRQNLQILAAARESAARDRIEPSLERVGLLHRADDRVSKYSMGMRQRLGVAACLIGDPQLLILDEPMNGLDPAGMQAMREMIVSLVAEGRTVVLSSHLLDEVERTCDAVAIVDRGRVVRQGPISALLAGTNLQLQIECSEPDRACVLIDATAIGAEAIADPQGLVITLPAGTGRDVIAEINRVLVEGGISVYRLQEVQASLESWFLQVTSRLGESQ